MIDPILVFLIAIAWGGIHSLMASYRMKQAVTQPASRFYRLGYNLFSGLTLIPVLALPVLLPDQHLYTISFPWTVLTGLLQLASVLILAAGVMQTGAFQFLGLAQLVESGPIRQNLVTGGLYRYVRHPLYSAGLVFIWLTPIMSANLLALYLAFTLYIIWGARLEERKLLKVFGPAYAEYRAQTPMFIPFYRAK